MGRTKYFAVTGRPVLHSLSPLLFGAGFARAGIDGVYTRLAADTAEEAMSVANKLGLDGMNVTAPFKQAVGKLVDRRDPGAEQVGAVNTVLFADGGTLGFNTDPAGVNHALASAGVDPDAASVVVLGTGAAATAALTALGQRAAGAWLVGRNSESGARLARRFGVNFEPWAGARRRLSEAACVIACLPRKLNADLDWMRTGQLVLDANYGDSALQAPAESAGCRYRDGLDWLVGQAVAGFEILCGAKTEPAVLKAASTRRSEAPKQPVVLVGMTGSGKTAVGRELSRLMQVPFTDTDRLVEQRLGKSVSDVFAEHGEPAFREAEASAITHALSASPGVVAIGGGALQQASTLQAVKQATLAVWLWADLEILVERTGTGKRPLLSAGDPGQTLGRMWSERKRSYFEAAQMVLDTGNRDPVSAAKRILYEID